MTSKIVPPLTYPGGKSKHIETFLNYIPPSAKTKGILSPFFGGGGFEFYLANHGYTVYASDNNPLLVNFYSCIKKDPRRLTEYVERLVPMTPQKFYTILNLLQSASFSDSKQYSDSVLFKLASFFYVLNKTSFNGLGRNISKEKTDRFNRRNFNSLKTFVFPPTLHLYCVDYKILLKKHPHMFAFVDPPYVKTITHYGLEGGKEKFDHVELADILMKRKSSWMLTYNDVPQIRKLYKSTSNKFISIDPTTGYANVSGTLASGYKQILVIHK
jgi:DNA adenine methylase